MGKFKILKLQTGQSLLMIVVLLSILGTFALFTSIGIYNQSYSTKRRDLDLLLLNEVTSSAFAIMESALARRLWEPPPDNTCLKLQSFQVVGTLSNGISWKVVTFYNTKTKNFEMTAEGTYKNLKSTYSKKVKVLDLADYLLFSGSTEPVRLSRLYNPQSSTAIIAGTRRIYTKGPVTFFANIDYANPKSNFNGSLAPWPGAYGTIIQGERIQFAGGIYYEPFVIPEPNPDGTNIISLLSPYSNAWGSPVKYNSQVGGGVALFTKDKNLSQTLNSMVTTNNPGPLTKSDVAKYVYPYALFGGSFPLESWNGVDTGAFKNDPDKQSIFYYEYGMANKFGVRGDYSCINKLDALTNKTYCSHSEHFKKGFSQWRKNANLEGVLFTVDSEEIPAPRINWDNLEALEEDATQCGYVLSNHNASAYEDCYIWDYKFNLDYIAANGNNVCGRVSPIDMEAITFSNFNAAQLTDPAKKDLLLRKVVYLKVPTEVIQSHAQGILVNYVPNPVARRNLSVWFVSEDLLALKGYQNDMTSPLTVNPSVLREVVFNQDSTTSNPALQLEPVGTSLLSSETIHLLSPFYIPLSYNLLKDAWPVVGGKIQPIRHNITDYLRYENDGFKYGYRIFKVNNASLITNSKVNVTAPFFLRGLWSGPDSSADQLVINQCMISNPGSNLTAHSGDPFVNSAEIPPYVTMVNSPIPPLTSNYYNGKNYFPLRYYPDVFWLQKSFQPSRAESDVVLNGFGIYTDFDSQFPIGKRDLSVLKYIRIDGRPLAITYDLSPKSFAWDTSYYFKTKPPGTACEVNNVEFIAPVSATEKFSPKAMQPSVNDGRYIFLHITPSDQVKDLGSIIGVDMPILESKN